MSTATAMETPAMECVRTAPTRHGEYLSFRLGAEEYGIELLRVQEIRGFEQPTRLAGAPESVCGVLNLRGVVVPIVDLRTHFGLDCRHDALTVTVILNVSCQTVGVVVDAVSDVVAFKHDQILPIPAFNGAIDTAHITGLGSIDQGEQVRTLILMDIAQLLLKAEVGLAH